MKSVHPPKCTWTGQETEPHLPRFRILQPRHQAALDRVAQVVLAQVDVPDGPGEAGVLDHDLLAAHQVDMEADAGDMGQEDLVAALDADRLHEVNQLLDLVAERRGQPPYQDRRVRFTVKHSQAEVVFVVRDEGSGFNPALLPDPRDPANLDKHSGRGLLLIRTFMDEVIHNERGNQITMVKRLDSGEREEDESSVG